MPQPQTTRTNIALSANGSLTSASSIYTYPGYSFPTSAAINGEHKGLNYYNNGTWHSGTNSFPQWLQVGFNASKTIDEIDVLTVQDNNSNPSEPTPTMTFSLLGLTAYNVQYWSGSGWVVVPGGSVSGNNFVWRKFSFSSIMTSKIRVVTNVSVDGWSRITELEAWGTAAGSSDSSGNSYSTASLDPNNQTGSGGVDLLSGNANWSLPILGLKGRAGLDLGLSLSYNSLVWTKEASTNSIKFDADRGMPSPGFRLGFPVIQSRYYNSQVSKYAYLLISPSCSHTELRQVGASNTYESADSSSLQLIDNGGGSLTLRPTDGSQLTYLLINGQYQCPQIKDRNGNYISVSYYSDGRINTITDTLSRVITFNYDRFLNLISITQPWGGATHTWATFGWGTQSINTGFTGMTVSGPQNGTSIAVLTQVSLDDGSRYTFEYNSYAQAAAVHYYAFDNHQRSYSLYTFPASSTDCPRVSESHEWVENWNNNQEAVTAYTLPQTNRQGK
jgi:YD repeat-containing protein